MTIDFFFEQLNSLVNSLMNLFKVEFTMDEVKKFSERFPDEEDVIDPVKKYTSFKKFTLNKKLSKIML